MSLKEIFQAKHFNKLLIILAVIVVLAFVFAAGIFVGHEKGRFSRNWGENYYRNVMGPRGCGAPGGCLGPGLMDFERPGFNARNGFGQIIKIEGDNLIVKGQGNVEKTIMVSDQTAIRRFDQSLKISDLQVDDNIVVLGRPDEQGRIEAKLIRVMPAAPFTQSAATSTKQ